MQPSRLAACVSIGLLLLSGVACAKKIVRYPAMTDNQLYGLPEQPLKGDDAPFLRIEKNIDRLVGSGRKEADLAATFKEAAQLKPLDAQAQFRWAYAAYLAQIINPGPASESLLRDVVPAMALPPNPRAYRYARLRWMVTTFSSFGLNQHFMTSARAWWRLIPKTAS